MTLSTPSAKPKALIFIPKSSTELILIAEKEWDKKQRQQHDKASWISGFLEGYFGKPVNIQQHDAAIREDERNQTLNDIYERMNYLSINALTYKDWCNEMKKYVESLRNTEAQPTRTKDEHLTERFDGSR